MNQNDESQLGERHETTTERFQPSDSLPAGTVSDHKTPHYSAIVHPRQASHMLSTNTSSKKALPQREKQERRAILAVHHVSKQCRNFPKIKVLSRSHQIEDAGSSLAIGSKSVFTEYRHYR